MKTPQLAPRFANEPGAQAAQRLFDIIRHDEPDAWIIHDCLLSLRNATYAVPDLYQLCRNTQNSTFRDVVAVMQWFRDAPGRCDLKEIFDSEGQRIVADLM